MADQVDPAALPVTEPTSAPIFDTGPFPEPLVSRAETAVDLLPDPDLEPDAVPEADPPPAPVRSVVVPGQYAALKWWQLVLVLTAVWVPAGAIGVGLYYWWVAEIDKTPAVFVTLVYVVVCTVGGLILAMAGNKPLLAAAAIAVMTAVFASLATVAPVYGHYFCQVIEPQGGRCLLGILPY